MSRVMKSINKKAVFFFSMLMVWLVCLSPLHAATNHDELAQSVPTTI